MTDLDKAAVLRRLERIAQDCRDDLNNGFAGVASVTLRRIDALADDLRKDLVAGTQEVAA